VDAARLSGATLRVFPHNHLGKLEKLLETASGRVLIVTEAIFSMDGDACALAEIIALKERFGAWLLLDEAHSVGVLGPQGRGLAAALGLESQIEIHMGTLSKSFGLSGGYIAASRLVVEHLINHARSLIYSTAPPPCLAHAALAALNIIAGEEGESRRQCLRQHVQQLMPDKPMVSAILPKIIGDEKAALEASARLRELGFLIPAIRYPTVAKGSARLRITPTAGHSAEQVQRLIEALQQL
jgi:7-keto-8-aminopelargonate synthetase-like enzyme